MSEYPVTVNRETGLDDALRLMRERNIRRLPVLDRKGRLVGIVSDKDLYLASPSPATSLDVFELRYLLSRLTVDKIMKSPVITVTATTTVEEAGRIMADKKIGGLPVVDEAGDLVGIITESDLFKLFVELLGGRDSGVRVTVVVPDVKGELAALTSAISAGGGNIIALSTLDMPETGKAEVMIKISDLDLEAVRRIMAGVDAEVADIRQDQEIPQRPDA
jgi:acetoin utilization protein AcuB